MNAGGRGEGRAASVFRARAPSPSLCKAIELGCGMCGGGDLDLFRDVAMLRTYTNRMGKPWGDGQNPTTDTPRQRAGVPKSRKPPASRHIAPNSRGAGACVCVCVCGVCVCVWGVSELNPHAEAQLRTSLKRQAVRLRWGGCVVVGWVGWGAYAFVLGPPSAWVGIRTYDGS